MALNIKDKSRSCHSMNNFQQMIEKVSGCLENRFEPCNDKAVADLVKEKILEEFQKANQKAAE